MAAWAACRWLKRAARRGSTWLTCASWAPTPSMVWPRFTRTSSKQQCTWPQTHSRMSCGVEEKMSCVKIPCVWLLSDGWLCLQFQGLLWNGAPQVPKQNQRHHSPPLAGNVQPWAGWGHRWGARCSSFTHIPQVTANAEDPFSHFFLFYLKAQSLCVVSTEDWRGLHQGPWPAARPSQLCERRCFHSWYCQSEAGTMGNTER